MSGFVPITYDVIKMATQRGALWGRIDRFTLYEQPFTRVPQDQQAWQRGRNQRLRINTKP